MQFGVKQGSLTQAECDVLIVNLFQGVQVPGGGTGAVDEALGGLISELIRDEGFEGSLGDTLLIRHCPQIPAKKVLVVGLGKQSDFSVLKIIKASGTAGRKCRELRAARVVSICHGAGIAGLAAPDCAKAVVLGTMLGTYEYTRLKTENVKPNSIESFDIVELQPEKIEDIKKGIDLGEAVGDAIIFARDLSNEPSNVVTPSYLAQLAQEIAGTSSMTCEVKNRRGIQEAGMGLLAAVSRGSTEEPRFIEIRYDAGAEKTVAIVGKGITFDSGGYSLKTAESMYGMKDDMSGAGDVLAVMRAIGRLKPNVNVIGLMPSTDNSIGADAIHPGDVFKSLSGKTVEVANTDAEGRLVLADALAYAKNLGVDQIIDAATLTGACVVALGHEVSGLFSNNDELARGLIKSGEQCGEILWQLPLHQGYRESLKSEVADLKNVGPRPGGAITAALFLESFVSDTPWAHLDLSAVVAETDTATSKKGATGAGAGAILEYLLSL